jgi:hypothetical protein
MNTSIIVTEIAVLVAKGRQRDAFKLLRAALQEAQDEAEPRLVEVDAEVLKLKKALAYNYRPTPSERAYWQKHCDEIWSAGGTPPDEEEWRVELALAELER